MSTNWQALVCLYTSWYGFLFSVPQQCAEVRTSDDPTFPRNREEEPVAGAALPCSPGLIAYRAHASVG